MTDAILGHEVVGSGPQRLIVLNDWLGDTTTTAGLPPLAAGVSPPLPAALSDA
jgi:hypothetical protein